MKHPARYSPEVLALIGYILTARYPGRTSRPVVHDPFAGTGERLVNAGLSWGFAVTGTEIEACFIEMPMSVRPGDSRDPSTYPPMRHVIVTSPVYANGMADSHLARDGSRRKNYRKAKAEMTGDPEAVLEDGNMGNHGYRGTKRPEAGGKSAKRHNYWAIADACVANWSKAELVVVNVSDFSFKNGQVEPHVADWKALLARHGWVAQVDHPVGTQRMRDGANADQRVDHEVVIVAARSTHVADQPDGQGDDRQDDQDGGQHG